MAGNRGFRRSFTTPSGYRQDPGGRVSLFNSTYVGFVKDNEDAFMMGRLRVWIPEFSPDSTDESRWFTVSYCSPFAGATPAKDLKKGSRDLEGTQTSYGWWAVPPDLDNEVVVMFINGDPARGVWIGSLYQQYMNHMVPGISSDKSFSPGENDIDPPVAEYNKWGGDVGTNENPIRPRYDPLDAGLKAQGLYEDEQRGPTDASARRDPVSKVYGFKSPGGTQFVFDDADNNSYVRIRTNTGAQLLINDTVGYVYVISGNGNSWLEVSDDGVDIYSANNVSVRAQKDFNIHADGSINMYAKSSINMYGGGGGSMQFGKNLDILTASQMNVSSAGNLNLLSQGSIAISTDGSMNLKSGAATAIDSGDVMALNAGGNLVLKGSEIQLNGGSGPTAKKATEASGPKPEEQSDRDLSNGYPEINTKTIVSRLVTHEPFAGHPGQRSANTRAPFDSSVSSRTQIDGNGNPTPDAPTDSSVPTDNTEFVSPTTGPITCVFGPRNLGIAGASRFHKGVDVGIPIGTPVVAMANGTVSYAGPAGGYGRLVKIAHDNGYETRYGHISQALVSPGQKVSKGQVIAKSGNAGVSSGPHLHFEIRKGGNAINPNTKLKNIQTGSRITAGRN